MYIYLYECSIIDVDDGRLRVLLVPGIRPTFACWAAGPMRHATSIRAGQLTIVINGAGSVTDYTMCVLRTLILLVDIQHTQCPR